jgi:hypothetical protein
MVVAARLVRGVRVLRLRHHLRRLFCVAAGVTVLGAVASIYLSVVGTERCHQDSAEREVCVRTEWYPLTLQRRSERSTLNGVPHGARTEWYSNGGPWLSGGYDHGKREGTWYEWYSDGTQRFRGTYDSDRLHGVETWWYPSGHMEWQVSRRHGERQGPEIWWHENGQRRRAGSYDSGERHGRYTSYGLDGVVSFHVEYHYGIRMAGGMERRGLED